jgi:hypothetical protein
MPKYKNTDKKKDTERKKDKEKPKMVIEIVPVVLSFE